MGIILNGFEDSEMVCFVSGNLGSHWRKQEVVINLIFVCETSLIFV